MWFLLHVSGLCVPLGWTSWSCRTVWSTAESPRFKLYRKRRSSQFLLANLVAFAWRCICFFCGIFLVWEGAYNHYPLQLHQTREGSTLPGADEREGGHTVVHWAGEVSRKKHTLQLFHKCFTQKLKCIHYLNTSISCDSNGGCVSLTPAGSSASRSTTQTCPTWVVVPDRSSWAGPGASLSSGICSHHSKTTSPVNRLHRSPAYGRQNTSFSILILAPTNKPHFVKSWTFFSFSQTAESFSKHQWNRETVKGGNLTVSLCRVLSGSWW